MLAHGAERVTGRTRTASRFRQGSRGKTPHAAQFAAPGLETPAGRADTGFSAGDRPHRTGRVPAITGEDPMNRLRHSLVVVAATLALAGGCATDDPHRRAKTGAVVGATVGAIAGHQVNGRNGKYVGAAVGAITGAAVGNYMDRQQRRLEQQLAAELGANDVRLTRIDEETLRVDLNSEATFDINSAGIRAGFRESLDKVAGVVGEYDRTAVHVIGHTDSTGSESYNQQLSERRAEAVTRHLVGGGVERSRTRVAGRGESAPIDSNATSAGRSRNRRVEIYLKPVVEGRENQAFRAPA